MDEASMLVSQGQLAIKTSNEELSRNVNSILQVANLSFAFEKDDNGGTAHRRILFQDISFSLGAGDRALVVGPRYVVVGRGDMSTIILMLTI